MSPDPLQAVADIVSGSSVQIPVVSFVINLLLAALLSFLLAQVYIRYADSLSNRKLFGRNFLLITMVTMLIITIVKSSIALSLGLVGALSIVRFRAAIKEPEELVYLFLAIGVGLGLGANQVIITVVAFLVITSIIVLRKTFFHQVFEGQNLFLTINSHSSERLKLENVVERLKEYSITADLKRFDETNDVLEATFLMEFSDYGQLNRAKDALRNLDESMSISFLDNKGVT